MYSIWMLAVCSDIEQNEGKVPKHTTQNCFILLYFVEPYCMYTAEKCIRLLAPQWLGTKAKMKTCPKFILHHIYLLSIMCPLLLVNHLEGVVIAVKIYGHDPPVSVK